MSDGTPVGRVNGQVLVAVTLLRCNLGYFTIEGLSLTGAISTNDFHVVEHSFTNVCTEEKRVREP